MTAQLFGDNPSICRIPHKCLTFILIGFPGKHGSMHIGHTEAHGQDSLSLHITMPISQPKVGHSTSVP
jgi:hypothetical protein